MRSRGRGCGGRGDSGCVSRRRGGGVKRSNPTLPRGQGRGSCRDREWRDSGAERCVRRPGSEPRGGSSCRGGGGTEAVLSLVRAGGGICGLKEGVGEDRWGVLETVQFQEGA